MGGKDAMGDTMKICIAGAGGRMGQALAEAVSNRRVAHAEVTDGLLVAAGGVLLFLPGLVTDVAGLLLVLPPTRALVRRRLVRAAEQNAPGLRTARIRSEGPIVDGTVVGGAGADGTGAGGPRRADAPGVIEGEIVSPEERRAS